METLFSYIKKYKDVNFDTENFTIIDALILTGIIYLPLPKAPSNDLDKDDNVGHLLRIFIDHPTAYKKCVMPLTDLKFARTLIETKRYKDVQMYGYYESIDDAVQMQFRAVTFLDQNLKQLFIAFCGTDTTLVGWKEDFNLGFEKEVPSQKYAREYVEDIAKRFPDYQIFIGGHSKGGNLALHSSVYCNKKTQQRIRYVFNFDGPGLLKEDLAYPGYSRIKSRIITILPSYTVVGILLGLNDQYRIIKSIGVGLYNHAFYYWQTKDKDFVYTDKISSISVKTAVLCENAYNSMSIAEKEILIDTMYRLVTASGAKTTHAIAKNAILAVRGASDAFENLDHPTKLKMADYFIDFISVYFRPLNKEEKKARKYIEEHATKK